MEYIKIEAKREGYTPGQVAGRGITVGELVDILKLYDEDTPVVLSHDGGYTYGSISQFDIDAFEYGEEEW